MDQHLPEKGKFPIFVPFVNFQRNLFPENDDSNPNPFVVLNELTELFEERFGQRDSEVIIFHLNKLW